MTEPATSKSPPGGEKSSKNSPEAFFEKKNKNINARSGTFAESALQAAKPEKERTAAEMDSMEGRMASQKDKGSHKEHGNESQNLKQKVQPAAAKGKGVVTGNLKEDEKLKWASDNASGEPKTRGKKKKIRQKGEKEASSKVKDKTEEVWPEKEDTMQLVSMVEQAGSIHGISLKRGGAIARLQSAADRGTSCTVSKKVADLLREARTRRPKDIKTRAVAQVIRLEHGKKEEFEGGKISRDASSAGDKKKAAPTLVRDLNRLAVDVPLSPVVQPQHAQQMGGDM
jgi:hypothetical protein